jgi:hypothetical protein
MGYTPDATTARGGNASPRHPRLEEAMATGRHAHHERTISDRMESAVGADMRLIYGIAVPMLATIGFIIALAVSGQGWMVPAVVVFLIITLAVVIFGLFEMLGEDETDETHS